MVQNKKEMESMLMKKENVLFENVRMSNLDTMFCSSCSLI